MHGRFTCPKVTTDVPRDQWPDDIVDDDGADLAKALNAEPAMQISLGTAMLMRWDNQDIGVSHEMWAVHAYVKVSGTPDVMRLDSFAAVQSNDTPESIAMAFASAIISSLEAFLNKEGEE